MGRWAKLTKIPRRGALFALLLSADAEVGIESLLATARFIGHRLAEYQMRLVSLAASGVG
jgi:hypothetical protein